MAGNRYDIVTSGIIAISLVIFLVATMKQLEQRKKIFICRGYLQHWGSALRLAHADRQFFGPSPGQNIEQWVSEIVSYVGKSEVLQCPAANKCDKGNYSYKINHRLLRYPLPKQKFQLPGNYIMIFDGHCDSHPVSSGRDPSGDVSNRHLGGANLLLGNGAVIYHRANDLKPDTQANGQHGKGTYRWDANFSESIREPKMKK